MLWVIAKIRFVFRILPQSPDLTHQSGWYHPSQCDHPEGPIFNPMNALQGGMSSDS